MVSGIVDLILFAFLLFVFLVYRDLLDLRVLLDLLVMREREEPVVSLAALDPLDLLELV